MPHDQRHLEEREDQRDRHDPPYLERDPYIVGRLDVRKIQRVRPAPDDLVEDCEEQEEQTPAKSQLAPALRVQAKGGIEDITKQRLAKPEAGQECRAEQRVDDGRLHLDEGVVV